VSTPIDREKLLTVGYLAAGRTRSTVREGRRADGIRVKATTDEAGNTVTEHAVKGDRVDVLLRPETVQLNMERRDGENR
jgi:hypothetical protein